MLKVELAKIIEKINENNDLEKLKTPLRNYLGFKKSEPIDQSYKLLSETSGLTVERVKELMTKYRLNKLLTITIDNTRLMETKTEFEEHLNKLSDFVLERYKEVI